VHCQWNGHRISLLAFSDNVPVRTGQLDHQPEAVVASYAGCPVAFYWSVQGPVDCQDGYHTQADPDRHHHDDGELELEGPLR
jgi:hypothetical protein